MHIFYIILSFGETVNYGEGAMFFIATVYGHGGDDDFPTFIDRDGSGMAGAVIDDAGGASGGPDDILIFGILRKDAGS